MTDRYKQVIVGGDIYKETYDDIVNRIIDYYEKHEKKK